MIRKYRLIGIGNKLDHIIGKITIIKNLLTTNLVILYLLIGTYIFFLQRLINNENNIRVCAE